MNYKHKQNGYYASPMESDDRIYDIVSPESWDNGSYKHKINTLSHIFIENTQDWELIPETPKMEVIEGVGEQQYGANGGYIRFDENQKITDCHSEYNSILIKNPTDTMRQIVNAVMEGKVYKRYIAFRSDLDKIMNGRQANKVDIFSEQGGCNFHKIYIIER